MIEQTDGLQRMLVDQKIEYLPIDNFTPAPDRIMRELINIPDSTAQLEIIHGSYVYKGNEGAVACRTYRDTRVFKGGKFVESRLDLLQQKPDVDSLMIVEDRDAFAAVFQEYSTQIQLKESLDYFFTMNVVTPATMISEIQKPSATAMKTILAFRPMLAFGNMDLFEQYIALSKLFVTDHDVQFQNQYDRRKELFRMNASNGTQQFTITREEYEGNYQLLLDSFEGKIHAGFPKERDKIVLPYSMGLKKKIDIT